MAAMATTYSKHFRRSGAVRGTFAGPGCIRQLRRFVEHSDWDERILAKERWIDGICLGVIIASALYLAPILVKVFLG